MILFLGHGTNLQTLNCPRQTKIDLHDIDVLVLVKYIYIMVK